MSWIDDFRDEANQMVLIQPFVRNDGYKDLYGEGQLNPCIIQYEVFNILKADGTQATTTAQIFLDGAVTVTGRDKIAFEGLSPKILKISPNNELGSDNLYGIVIFT